MVHIIYGLVCREYFVGDEVYRVIKKVDNHWLKNTNNVTVYCASGKK
jgi:hypothetical protein